MTCWRGECRRGCYYPDACNEGDEQPEAIREAFALGAAWALGDDDEAPAALKARVDEAEYLLRMVTAARDRAERQAEQFEAELGRLKAAVDKVGHQAVCPVTPCDCWMRDLAPLLDECAECAECGCGVDGDGKCPCGCNEPPECSGLCGEHHWLDRPESDTRECLICGTEVSG